MAKKSKQSKRLTEEEKIRAILVQKGVTFLDRVGYRHASEVNIFVEPTYIKVFKDYLRHFEGLTKPIDQAIKDLRKEIKELQV